jgi:hypothetical protein
MDNNYTQIERYLQNEMDAAERSEFENKLAADRDLQKEFTVQEQITRAAFNAGIKQEFNKAIQKKILTRRIIRIGIAVLVVGVAFLFYALMNGWFSRHGETRVKEGATEQFEISTATDTIIETKDGVVFAIPANAFDNSGNKIQVEIKTALDAASIIENGLSTMSNGAMLETGGMFYINAYEDGKQLAVIKSIDVSVPAREINPAMQLFEGVADTNGIINWVNPKPIEKKLRTYDITTLDFYPADYIPALKGLKKEYRNKKYTDSLYYSFSGYPYSLLKESKEESSISIISNDNERPDTGRENTDTGYVKKDSVGEFDFTHTDAMHYEIDPGKIRAIWNEKFNNTILATKEFEERLRFIHTLCDPSYLDAYVQALNKPMYKIDQWCAENSSGDIKKKFLEFAARKDGSVLIAAGMQEKLSVYFQQKYKAYQEASTKTWEKYQNELNRLNAIADTKRRAEEIKRFSRENKNFEEELCANLTDAYRQIGVSRNCKDTVAPPPPAYYNITITTTGWKNLDVYVLDATTMRQSMSYTDPETGKTAMLTYKPVTISIDQRTQYDKVMVYLIPSGLSSFQRMPETGSLFKESLNSLFRYDAVAVGYKGDKLFFATQQSLQEPSYTLQLSSVTEKQLNIVLNKYSPGMAKDLKVETAYQLFEQLEELRQVKILDDWTFKGNVAAAIFKCVQGDGAFTMPVTPNKDTISKSK